MIFKDDFYTINASHEEENATIYSVTINKGHAIFKGHFPGNPVTPGVVQMEVVKELMQVTLGKEMNLLSMGNCKFLAVLNPEETADVDITLNITETEDGNSKVKALIQQDETTFLKMSAVYIEKN